MAERIKDFFKDGGIVRAGSIAYFTMMALIPFSLFLVTVFGYLLGHYHGFYQFLANILMNFFPEITSEVTKQLGKLIAFKGIGKLSLVLYGILSMPAFYSFENALHVIFKVKKKRPLYWSFVLSLIVITLLSTVLVVSFLATSLIPLLRTLRDFFPELRVGLITGFLIRYVVPFFMVLLITMLFYIFLPRTRVKVYHAFIGALFTTIFLEIAKHIFAWYVGTVVNLGTIYGPLTAFFVFLLWVFYSSSIFLIGAEVVHNQASYRK